MSIEVRVRPIHLLTRGESLSLRELCNDGSQMQGWFDGILEGEPVPPCWVAFVRRRGKVVAWASVSDWRDHQQVQAFTHEAYRGRGLMRLAVQALVAEGLFARSQRPERSVATFSPTVAEAVAAQGLSVADYEKQGEEWVLVARIEGAPHCVCCCA